MNPRPRLSCQDSPEASSTTVSCATQNIHADGALFARMHAKSVFKSCDCLLCNCSTEIGQDGGKFVCARDERCCSHDHFPDLATPLVKSSKPAATRNIGK